LGNDVENDVKVVLYYRFDHGGELYGPF